MRAEEQFDSFYLKTRRALVHQTFALTGDLAAAERAVRDAYVGGLAPLAQGGGVRRPAGLGPPTRLGAGPASAHRPPLAAHPGPVGRGPGRCSTPCTGSPAPSGVPCCMVHLAGVPLDVAARELNLTQETLERQLQSATAGVASALGTDSADGARPAARARRRRLARRAPPPGGGPARGAQPPAHPQPSSPRRWRPSSPWARARSPTSRSTRRTAPQSSAVGSPADPSAGPGTEAADTLVSSPSPTPSPRCRPPTTCSGRRTCAPSTRTRGGGSPTPTTTPPASGINYVCQQERFADPGGLATIVQTSEARRRPARTVVQAVEMSASEEEAAGAYDRVLEWFAGCEGGELQLDRTFDVARVGDRATAARPRGLGVPATVVAGRHRAGRTGRHHDRGPHRRWGAAQRRAGQPRPGGLRAAAVRARRTRRLRWPAPAAADAAVALHGAAGGPGPRGHAAAAGRRAAVGGHDAGADLAEPGVAVLVRPGPVPQGGCPPDPHPHLPGAAVAAPRRSSA